MFGVKRHNCYICAVNLLFSREIRPESFSTIAGDFNRNLKEQTENVGLKADHLANALRGQHKMQGCWGETQLNHKTT